AILSPRLRPRTSSLALGGLALLLWVSYPGQINRWNGLLEQQACVRSLAKRIQIEVQDTKEARVIACEIRAHGLAFYLGETVEITAGEADIVLPQVLSDRKFPVIHSRPQDIAKLRATRKDASPVFVVTRKRRFEKNFAKRG